MDAGRAGVATAYLQVRLGQVEAAVAAAYERRATSRAAGPDEALHAAADDVAVRAGTVSADVEEAVAAAVARGADVPLRGLARTCDLDAADVALLLVAVAPDVDPRFERFYAHLHGEPTGRATAGLALELCGLSAWSGADRARLGPAGRLVAGGLLVVADVGRPLPSRSLVVPDRVVGHLLGDPTEPPELAGLLVDPGPSAAGADDAVHDPDGLGLRGALRAGAATCYVRGPHAGPAAAAAVARLDHRTLVADLAPLPAGGDGAWAVALLREARLLDAVLVAGPVDVLDPAGLPALRALADAAWPTVLHGTVPWEPEWSHRVAYVVDAPAPRRTTAPAAWASALPAGGPDPAEVARATAAFSRLGPVQVHRAVEAGRLRAAARATPLEVEDVRHGARQQGSGGLDRLARRVVPVVGPEDMVLPASTAEQLRDVVRRCRYADVVLDRWGLGAKVARRRGVACLFAGPPGTGKTMAAEVVAGELGLELYVVDLATLVDKYIGETEKNLERLFTAAERADAVLFFDEADALFGKRSEVRDARDRYANLEVSYLLQRLERFDGVAMLTTNLRANVDDAFLRRLDAVVDFPAPDAALRRALWSRLLDGVPLDPAADLDALAREVDLTGGHLRNVVLGAAFLAASDGGVVGTAQLLTAAEREYRKLGRLWDGAGLDAPARARRAS